MRRILFKYLFGTKSFKRTLLGMDNDMVHLRRLYLKSLEKRNAKKNGDPKYIVKAKYTVYGYAIALQYWAYKVIVQLGSKYATCLGVKTPRMLSWTSNLMIQKDNLAEDLKRKKVSIFKYSGFFFQYF